MGNAIGAMDIPPDFKYLDVFLHGRPRHDRYDRFSAKHPKMDLGKRAKIFAPFDALRGFSEMVASKTVAYEPRRELANEDRLELSRRLAVLRNLTYTSRQARLNRVAVTASYFVVCTDLNHYGYGVLGQIKTVSGICWKVDPDITRTILIDDTRIAFDDLLELRCKGNYFSAPMYEDIWQDD